MDLLAQIQSSTSTANQNSNPTPKTKHHPKRNGPLSATL
jgi:hypothetical protein